MAHANFEKSLDVSLLVNISGFLIPFSQKAVHPVDSRRRRPGLPVSPELVHVFAKNVSGSQGRDQVVKFGFLASAVGFSVLHGAHVVCHVAISDLD